MEMQQPKPKPQPLYSKHLQNYVNNVIDQGTLSRKQLQQFISAFQKRVDAQLYYAKNLQSLAKIMEKYILPGTQKCSSYVASAFKVHNQQRAHQAKELADSLKAQVIDHANQILKQHLNQAKKIQKNVKKYNKDLITYEETLARAQKNYKEIDKETEQMIITKNIVKYTSQLPQQKKIKLISKTMQSLKEKRQYENLYIQSVTQYNQFIQVYQKQMASILNTLQDHQESRVKIQSDCIRKLIVCDFSMFKNLEYDSINISQKMQTIDPHKDIESFVHQTLTKNKQSKDQLAKQDNSKRFQQKTLEIDKSMLAISLRKVQQQYFAWLLNIKKNKQIKRIIEQRWKFLNGVKQTEKQGTTNIVDKVKQKQPQSQQVQSKNEMKQEAQNQAEKNEQNNSQNNKQKQKSTITNENTNNQPQQLNVNKQNQSKQNRQSYQQNPSNKHSSQIFQEKSEKSDNASNKQQKYLNLSEKDSQTMLRWVQIHQKQKLFTQPALTGQATLETKSGQQTFIDFLILTQIISRYWLGTIEPTGKKLKNSYHMIKIKKIIRKGNHLMRILAYIFIEQYRVQHRVLISSSAIKPIAEIFAMILDQCNKNDDAYVGRGLIDQKNNKKLLYQQNSIGGSKLWKKLDFWDAAIFQSTYEQMAIFSIQKGQTHSQTVLRQKNLIFSQLASYCHYMIMLGISSKSVRLTVGRYCRLYQMSQQQNKDLSKMITNTFRQYKDMLAMGALGN